MQEQSNAGPASGKRSFANDLVWRVPFRHRSEDDGESAWLHLVLMIEVQGGDVDHLMALRIRDYVDNHHMELWRGRRFGAGDRLAPVLPIVIYTGATRWTAARRVIDLVTPTSSTVASPRCRRGPTTCSPGTGTSRFTRCEWRRTIFGTTMPPLCWRGFAIRRCNASQRRWRRCGRGSMRQRSGNFLEIVLLWAQQMAQRLIGLDLGIDDMGKLDRLHESGELEATSRRAVGPIRNGTVPRVWRRASNEAWSKASEAWNEASPQSGTCCAGKRIASSTPARRRGLQASWPTLAMPRV